MFNLMMAIPFQGKGYFPYESSVLEIEKELDWNPSIRRVSDYPLAIIDDGSVLYYRYSVFIEYSFSSIHAKPIFKVKWRGEITNTDFDLPLWWNKSRTFNFLSSVYSKKRKKQRFLNFLVKTFCFHTSNDVIFQVESTYYSKIQIKSNQNEV